MSYTNGLRTAVAPNSHLAKFNDDNGMCNLKTMSKMDVLKTFLDTRVGQCFAVLVQLPYRSPELTAGDIARLIVPSR